MKRASNNTSGYAGVHYDKANGKWKAHIIAYGQYFSLGQHDTVEDAAKARAKGVRDHGRDDYPYAI